MEGASLGEQKGWVGVTPEEIVAEQFAAYNARDLDRFVGCFADDVAVYGFPSGTKMLTAGDRAAAVGNVVRCRPTTSTMPDPTSQWGVAPPLDAEPDAR